MNSEMPRLLCGISKHRRARKLKIRLGQERTNSGKPERDRDQNRVHAQRRRGAHLHRRSEEINTNEGAQPLRLLQGWELRTRTPWDFADRLPKDWSGREDLKLQPPGPEPAGQSPNLLVWDRLGAANVA